MTVLGAQGFLHCLVVLTPHAPPSLVRQAYVEYLREQCAQGDVHESFAFVAGAPRWAARGCWWGMQGDALPRLRPALASAAHLASLRFRWSP